MTVRTVSLRTEGHLIDTGLLSRYLALVVENGATYELRHFEIGRSVEDFSKLWFTVAGDAEVLEQVVADLVSLGCIVEGNEPVTLRPSLADRTVPDDFYSTTNHKSEVYHAGAWVPVQDQRMDACLVIDAAGVAHCVKLRDIRCGDCVVCGATGVRVHPPFKSREATDFVFMGNEVSSERRVERMVDVIAHEMQAFRARGGRIIVVAGPVVVQPVPASWLPNAASPGQVVPIRSTAAGGTAVVQALGVPGLVTTTPLGTLGIDPACPPAFFPVAIAPASGVVNLGILPCTFTITLI